MNPFPAEDPRYFRDLYAQADDPWGLAERFYEQRKRAILLASLPRPRFNRVFEPGCATGLLTVALAERADDVLAWDVAEAALTQTTVRVKAHPHVRVEAGQIPGQWPDGEFDLVVLSEVGYYCRDLDQLTTRCRTALATPGWLVACHWRHDAHDHPHTAEDVHRALGAGLHEIVYHDEGDFLLQAWSRDAATVAQMDGIIA